MNIHLPTIAEIEGAKTAAGGWTRRQLAEWGVPWPPPPGWKATLFSAALRMDERISNLEQDEDGQEPSAA
jgi:hypothetical protein